MKKIIFGLFIWALLCGGCNAVDEDCAKSYRGVPLVDTARMFLVKRLWEEEREAVVEAMILWDVATEPYRVDKWPLLRFSGYLEDDARLGDEVFCDGSRGVYAVLSEGEKEFFYREVTTLDRNPLGVVWGDDLALAVEGIRADFADLEEDYEFYVKGILVHEFGHILGLRHETDPAVHSVMWPAFTFFTDENGEMTIPSGDIVSFCQLYNCSSLPADDNSE